MALCNSEFFQPLTYLASVNSPKTFRFRHRSSVRKPAAATSKRVRKPAAATSKPRTILGNFLKMNAYRIFPRYSHDRDQFGPLKASIPRFSRQSLYRFIQKIWIMAGQHTFYCLMTSFELILSIVTTPNRSRTLWPRSSGACWL